MNWFELRRAAARPLLLDAIPDLLSRSVPYTTPTDYLNIDILRSFLSHLDQRLREIEAALRTEDFPCIRSAGHDLKGLGGTCGAPEISVLGEALEEAAQAGDGERCHKLLEAARPWLQAIARDADRDERA